jgi:DNA-binding NarL/FixJ family response regulator
MARRGQFAGMLLRLECRSDPHLALVSLAMVRTPAHCGSSFPAARDSGNLAAPILHSPHVSAPKPIRVLVVDDHHVVRSGLAMSLGLEDDIAVVAEAGTAEEALAQYRAQQPDMVLMDLRLPGTTGTAVTTELRKEWPQARVLIFTTFDGDEDVYRAMQAGALGYLLKSAERAELLLAIRTVATGQRFLPPELSLRLASRVAAPDLSEREIEVLRLISDGKSNKEIGKALYIAEDTVKRHVSNILTKLGVSDRAQAATEAIRRGFLHI